MKVLFVSEKVIKENSIIEDNTDSKIIKITLDEIQQLELKPIIGDELYNEIESEIVKKSEDSQYEIPENIINALDIIKPFLIYGVLSQIAIPLTYKATNKGFVVKDDTSADTTSGTDLGFIINFYRSKFDAFKKRLIKDFGECSNNFMKSDLGYTTGWYINTNQKVRDLADRVVNKY